MTGLNSDPACDRADSLARENRALRAEVARLTRERDAWSDEAVKMLRQRNVVLEWARERAGFAHVHDVMIAAGLAAAPAGDPDLEGHVCAACGARATRVGDSKAIWCAACGTGRWVSKPKSADPAPPAPAIDPANPPLRLDLQRRRMTRCQSDDDDCDREHCPQLRDGEPKATGQHCPLDIDTDEDG